MPQLAKRKRTERAHRYRVIAQQLDFHLTTGTMGDDVDARVRAAKEALLSAADLLETREEPETQDNTPDSSVSHGRR